LLQKY